MPSYAYRAADTAGCIMRGTATAANESDLAQFLGQSRLELIEAREKKKTTSRTFLTRVFQHRVEPRALALFCKHVADLLQADMVLLDIFNDLASVMEAGILRDALFDIIRSINHGSRITAAFARHPHIFPPVFIAILQAGEASGSITRSFQQLATYVESRAAMNERLRRATRYPLFLVCVACGVISFMMLLVVPQIVTFLASIDSQLPLATRVLITVSDIFGAVWWIGGLALIAGVALTFFLRRHSTRFARAVDALLLRIPVVGGVMRKFMLARFAECLSILVESGLTIPDSMIGAKGTLGNRALEAQLEVIIADIIAGRSLSEAMRGFFPPFAVRLLRIGEQGGRLPKSLADIATHYDREAADATDRMIGSLEPGLTLLIGAILAWVVLAVLGPIYASLGRMNVMG